MLDLVLLSVHRQQPAFRRLIDMFLVQHGLAYLLPQGVTMRTSGHVLSLAAMFLRQAYYGYFEVSLSDVHAPKRVINHLYDSMMFRRCVDIMKSKGLHIRISERRLNKLRLYAANKEKTMTQLVEDWIDRLPISEIDNRSDTHKGYTS